VELSLQKKCRKYSNR